ILFFFFSSRRRHTRFSRDWSSDVCSSDLAVGSGNDATGIAAAKRLVSPAHRGARNAGGIVAAADGGGADCGRDARDASGIVKTRSEERRVGNERSGRVMATGAADAGSADE